MELFEERAGLDELHDPEDPAAKPEVVGRKVTSFGKPMPGVDDEEHDAGLYHSRDAGTASATQLTQLDTAGRYLRPSR